MSLRIDQDHARFKQIVRGRIRKNLRKYISQGELIGRQGKDTVSIPIPQIDIPRFRFSSQQQGGVGQGDGEPGDPVGQGQDGDGSGPGEAGEQAGDHVLEVELTLDELAEILGEELELPNIEDRGQSRIVSEKDRYVGIRNVGPNSLRHFRRTFRNALRRQITMGTYDAKNPVIVPMRDDMRYRSWRTDTRGCCQRSDRLHDGRFGLNGRPAKRHRSNRVFLDRRLAPETIRRRRDTVYHSRCDRA